MPAKTLEPKRLKSINIRLPSDKEYYTKVLSSSLTVWGWIDMLHACLLVAVFQPFYSIYSQVLKWFRKRTVWAVLKHTHTIGLLLDKGRILRILLSKLRYQLFLSALRGLSVCCSWHLYGGPMVQNKSRWNTYNNKKW